MSKGKVSVIVPVYNAQYFIERCVYSIINQTFGNLEIIIVNDGSTDNTLDIVQILSQKDARIKLISQSNKGEAYTRGVGVGAATGDFIVFCDADDYMPEDAVEYLHNKIIENECDIVLCSSIDINVDGSRNKSNNTYHGIISSDQYIAGMLRGDITFGSVCKIFRREVLNRYPFNIDFRIKNNLDLYLNIGIGLQSNKILITDRVVYYYEIKNNSMSFTSMDPHIWIRLLHQIKEILIQYNKYISMKQFFDLYAYRILLSRLVWLSPNFNNHQEFSEMLKILEQRYLTYANRFWISIAKIPYSQVPVKLILSTIK